MQHLTFPKQKAHTGLLSGREVDPEDNIGTAGFCTVSVAPYGYTNDGVLETGGNSTLLKYNVFVTL